MILHPPNSLYFLILRGRSGARVSPTATAWHLPMPLPGRVWPKEELVPRKSRGISHVCHHYSLIDKVESEREEAVTVGEAGLITTMPNIYSLATNSIGFLSINLNSGLHRCGQAHTQRTMLLPARELQVLGKHGFY